MAGRTTDAAAPRPFVPQRYENAKFPGGNYCGVTQDGQRGYNKMLSYSGDVIAQPPVQATLDEGGEVDIKFRLTAHHKGHVELGACCKDPATTSDTQMQKCFNKNKLTFVKDKLYGGNFHPQYPERGYVAPPASGMSTESSTATAGPGMPFRM